MMMNVSILIVNYNTRELLADCLRTVYEQTHGITFEVIVVDNASTDGSEEYVLSRFPAVRWIASGENLGFGKANNLGASRAQGEYLFLLNSDTLLLNNAVKMFYDYAVGHKEFHGVTGGWLLKQDGSVNSSYGEFPSVASEMKYLYGRLKDRLRGRRRQEACMEKEVDYIIGADMFLPRELYDRFGGFDPNIFMYCEETDLQLRMAKAGVPRRLIVGPQIVHLEGGSFERSGLTYSRFVMLQTSYNYFVSKHYSGIHYVWFKSILGIVRLFVFTQSSWTLKERIKAYFLVLKK